MKYKYKTVCNGTVAILRQYDDGFRAYAYVYDSKILAFVYRCSTEGYFGVQFTNDPEKEFKAANIRKLFPEGWKGMRGCALVAATGYGSALFCKPDGYLAGFSKKSDAIGLAIELANSVSPCA
jgi:uncharacterized UPF0160 family protein